MELQLEIIGFLSILLAVAHVIFPKYFNWKEDLRSVSLINKQLMYVHTFFIAFFVFLIGVFLINCSYDIIYTGLGRMIALGLFIFWGVRLIFQFFVYSTKLWKGKLFETIVHIIASLLWLYFTTVFFLVYWQYNEAAK